jgi:hypothetical protein
MNKRKYPIIKLNDQFEIHRDSYNWILVEWRDGFNKDGEPTITGKNSYHPNLKMISRYLLDEQAKDCESLQEIIDLFDNAVERLANHIQVEAS